jgi:hypothetical protein
VPLGSTPDGADWCLKALHPSDPQTEVRGIPDHSAVPSLLMNYQSTFVLTPHNGATGTWSFVASLLPHPVNFMYVDYSDSTATNTELNFMNTQLEGEGHFNKYASFVSMVQRWRLAYMSVTCYQDGPELANQGTIVVSQAPVQPRRYSFAYIYGTNIMAPPPVEHFDNEDRPNFTTSQSMPNSYFGRSKEGAYVPLKLTETCQDWVSDANRVSSAPIYREGNNYGVFVLPNNQNMPGFPHVNLAPAYFDGANGPHAGLPTSPMLNATWAHICAKICPYKRPFLSLYGVGLRCKFTLHHLLHLN